MIPSFGEIDTIGPRKVIRASVVLLAFLVLFPTMYSGVGTAKADSVIATLNEKLLTPLTVIYT